MEEKRIDVFISYSSIDKHIADAACNRLESNDIRCWYAPRDIAPGTDWASSIIQAIKRAKVFLLIYSGSSNQSKQVYNELTAAFNAQCVIIPFRVDDTVMTDKMAYYLNAVHWFDALTPPLERNLDFLSRYVRNILDGKPEKTEVKKKAGKRWLGRGIAAVMAAVILGTAAFFGARYLWDVYHPEQPDQSGEEIFSREETEDSTTGESENTAPAEVNEEETASLTVPVIQNMKLQCFNRTGGYVYPGYGTDLISLNASLFLMEKESSGCVSVIDLRTGKVLIPELDHPFPDLYYVTLMTTSEYDTMYFLDESSDMVYIYDRKNESWINREGILLPVSDTEVYTTFMYQSHSFHSNNEDMETVCLFYYDLQLGCYSQLIWFTPDGMGDVYDIRELGLTDIVNAFENSSGFESEVMMVQNQVNLVVLDVKNGCLVDVPFQTIMEEYIPQLDSGSSMISADGRYLLYSDGQYTKVWDIQLDKLVFNRSFTQNYTVCFAGENELAYYSNSDHALHIYDLQTQSDKVQLDESYFRSNKTAFLDVPYYQFYYSQDYDLYFWFSCREQLDGSMKTLLTATDKDGNIYAQSADMAIPAGSYAMYMFMEHKYLLAVFVNLEAPAEERPDTILYRAMYSEDSDGFIKFADVYYYDD